MYFESEYVSGMMKANPKKIVLECGEHYQKIDPTK